NGGPFTVTFINTLAGQNVAQIASSATGSATVITGSNGYTNVSVNGPGGGPFTITFWDRLSGVYVKPLTLEATGNFTGSFKTILEGGVDQSSILSSLQAIPELANPGDVSVSAPVNGTFVVNFQGGLNNRDLPALTTTTTGGSSATIAQNTTGFGN